MIPLYKHFVWLLIFILVTSIVLFIRLPRQVVYNTRRADKISKSSSSDYHHYPIEKEEPTAARSLTKHITTKVQPTDFSFDEERKSPIIIWWTGFTGDPGTLKTCGEKKEKCFFSVDKKLVTRNETFGFLFYGTDIEPANFPLPRQPHHLWALLHEESPKNVFYLNHEDALAMFNYTSTFRRESDFPLVTIDLPDMKFIRSHQYLRSVSEKNKYRREGHGLVAFVHSDCGTPSDRDYFIRRLKAYLPVDSLGGCEHNKDLPKHLQDSIQGMNHPGFYEILSRYKFVIYAENSYCKDYITEKFWRCFHLGIVPLLLAPPHIKDFLPDPHSAIFISDYNDFASLAEYLKYLDENDSAYEEFLVYKHKGIMNQYLADLMANRTWGGHGASSWMSESFVDAFGCYFCREIYKYIRTRKSKGRHNIPPKIAQKNHYGCPVPKQLERSGRDKLKWEKSRYWTDTWEIGKTEALALKLSLLRNKPYSLEELRRVAAQYDKLGTDFSQYDFGTPPT